MINAFQERMMNYQYHQYMAYAALEALPFTGESEEQNSRVMDTDTLAFANGAVSDEPNKSHSEEVMETDALLDGQNSELLESQLHRETDDEARSNDENVVPAESHLNEETKME